MEVLFRGRELVSAYYAPERGPDILPLSDCSTAQFLCKRLAVGIDRVPIILWVPREIRFESWPAVRLYELNGSTGVASLAQLPAGKAQPPAIRFVVWQGPGGIGIPIVMTVELGRGVTYLTGLSPWRSNVLDDVGGTCALRSRVGLFKDTAVHLTEAAGPAAD